MAYLGLVPGENSTGEKQRRGPHTGFAPPSACQTNRHRPHGFAPHGRRLRRSGAPAVVWSAGFCAGKLMLADECQATNPQRGLDKGSLPIR